MFADAAVPAQLKPPVSGARPLSSDHELDAAIPVDGDADDLRDLEAGSAKGAPTSALEIAVHEFLNSSNRNQTRIDNLARLMFNDARVRKICRLRALKMGVDLGEVDDVLQRTMEVFFSKMLSKLNSYDAVYAVVYAVANNVSKEVSREAYVLISGHDSIEELKEKGGDIRESDRADYEEPDNELEVDSRIRKSNWNGRFKKSASEGKPIVVNAGVVSEVIPLVEFVRTKAKQEGGPVAIVMPKPPSTKDGKKAERDLSADQQELVDIIRKLEMRNQDFAVLLGIGLPRLSSYIYGRTASVPKQVMDDARRIFREQNASLAGVKAQFSKKMSEIIKDWETRLQTNTNEELAKYLGVTTMTIHRWRTDETQPDLTALVRYDQTVTKLEQQMKAAQKQMMRQLAGKK